MSEVWLVLSADDDAPDPRAVYSSRERAVAAVEAHDRRDGWIWLHQHDISAYGPADAILNAGWYLSRYELDPAAMKP